MSWTFEDVMPRARVVSDNDYAGDPDGLVQLAQLVLSPSVVVPFVIGSHLPAHGFTNTVDSAARAAVAARRVVELCGRDVNVIAGVERALTSRTEPIESDAARAIVAEAMRDDTDLPLFVACGGGLTEIASAWLIEPRIGERVTLVWIGGHEHPGTAEPPPGGGDLEFNTSIDPLAAQVVFNDSDLPIWQVPRNVYRTAIASRAELMVRMRPHGELGHHLFDALADAYERVKSMDMQLGEVWVMGDSPLVSLTALWTGFEPAPASSPWVTVPCPRILDSGLYEARPDGRPLRVFTDVDSRLMLEDLYAKLALHAEGQR
jgi:inosine-uridine nucleoside N-ribohydrolase